MALCEYGCGNVAQYTLKNNKSCCSESQNQCPAVRQRISLACRESYRLGRFGDARERYEKLSPEKKNNMNWRKGKVFRTDAVVFKIGSTYPTHYLKQRILDRRLIPYHCGNCGIDSWNGDPIDLSLDRINGDHTDNRLENLRFLCPNCKQKIERDRPKISKPRVRVPEGKVIRAIHKSKNIRQVLLAVGLAPKGQNYQKVRKIMEKYKLEFKKT